MPAKVGRPAIGPMVNVAVPEQRMKELGKLARKRRMDLERRGTRTRLLRYVLDAGFEALRARGEL